jgi:thymidine phosphorylase
MLVTDIIRRKRDGAELTAEEIAFFVAGLADGSIPAEQVSALAMAVCFNSMTAGEAGCLTMDMAASGTVLDWRDEGLDGPVADKHSTGGVGDKVSFLLAPIAAACGCYVPMISGRGLGHTGGTTDKVESIPGYDATPDFELFRKVVRETGCAIIGQTGDLAPADRRFYAIRDVTGTVESVPLITASILSKKIAAGLEVLVMDVKTGTGAFMASPEQARELADSILSTARTAGLKTHVLITDMNECLGRTAGNALEIAEAMQFLAGDIREPRLDEVVTGLTAEMLVATGLEPDRAEARRQTGQAVTSGRAAEVFGKMVAGLGGPADFVERHTDYLPAATVRLPVHAETSGYLQAVDALRIGNAIVELGGGRRRMGDSLDLAVGLSDVATIGETVDAERPLAVVHASSVDSAELAAKRIRVACTIGDAPPSERPVIQDIVAGN